MRRRIKTKILLGFLVVMVVLTSAGGISIYEVMHISGLVQSLIHDNFKTIQAAENMMEALERKDSGVLLLLLGDFRKGSEILHQADSSFMVAMTQAERNVTDKGEDSILMNIKNAYVAFNESINLSSGVDTINNLTYYQQAIVVSCNKTKQSVRSLIKLNQEELFREASQMEEQSKRALMPGIIAIAIALVFLVMLNFFISKFYIKSIISLTDIIRVYQKNPKGALVVKMDSDDEIKELASAVEKLVETLKY
jgi:hypothetical protein